MHLLQPRPPDAISSFGAASIVGVVPAAALVLGGDAGSAAVAAACSLVLVAAVVDFRTGRIPDRLVALAVGCLAVVPWVSGDAGLVGPMALGAALFAGPLFVVHMCSPAAMGFGDVKLALPLGAIVGIADARLAVLALFVASFTAGVVGLTLRRPNVSFGPALVFGAAFAVGAAGLEGVVPWR